MKRLAIIVIAALGLVSVSCNNDTDWLIGRVEWATKMDFPQFTIDECTKGSRSFTGDYEDEYKAIFTEVPDQAFYDQIDQLCCQEDTAFGSAGPWTKIDATHYEYYNVWGNGIPDPDGKLTEEDAILIIFFEKGAREFTIREGRW